MNSASQPESRIGTVVDDRWRIAAHLGSGGMANVYRAEHLRTGAPVAIKVLHRELSSHPEISARFQREVLAARSVQHPNVVAAMDFGKLDDGSLYLVLEYIQGEDLVTRLHRIKLMPPARAVHITLQVADVLVVAHGAGVVHRDLKPDNIMLIEKDGDPDFVKVVDFGIAKLALPGTGGQQLTALGSVFGTPEYMAPEQARGTVIDPRADLYTLGIVLYEMLAGQTPFASQDPTEILIAQITKPPPPLPEAIDPELSAIVMQLLQKDPAKRIPNAAELAQRLRGVLTRSVAAAPPPALAAPPPVAAPVVVPSMPTPAVHAPPAAARPAQRPSNAPASGCALALVLILVSILSLAIVVIIGFAFGWI